MLDPGRTGEYGDYRPLTPEQWERRRQEIIRDAGAARTRALRKLFGLMLLPVRRLAESGRDLAWPLAARTVAAARRFGRAYATWRSRRQAIRELGALDDRALKDFGINRSEIESVVYGRDAAQVTEGKIVAVLFHKPYDRRCAGTKAAARQPVKKSAA